MNNTALKKTPTSEGVLNTKSTEMIAIQEQSVKQDFDIDGFLTMRQEFITKVKKIMVKGSDYHEIQNKKSLAKGGAEKIASIFGWSANFEKDSDVLEAFKTEGLIAFVCNLTKSGVPVGQGRGAASLGRNASDPNKTIKMAQKSAFIDAVLRASGLSDFFTQDLEDHPEHLQPRYMDDDYPNLKEQNDMYYGKKRNGYENGNPIPVSDKQIGLIDKLLDQKRLTKEDLIDEGFDYDKLTGGKEGTASELITFLLAYIPKTSITTDEYNRTKEGKEMEEKLRQAKDPGELMELKAQLGTMKRHFTKSDLEALKEVYLKAESEIMSQE